MKRLFFALTLTAVPTLLAAQTPPPAATPPAYNAGGLPRTPTYNAVEGQPIDSRTPDRKSVV